MMEIIEQHRTKLEDLCRRFHVRQLDLFGSAADGRFDPVRSDLDFLVEFADLAPGPYADAFFGLLHGLEELFQRPIDLVIPRAIRNKYFFQAVNQHRQVVYAA